MRRLLIPVILGLASVAASVREPTRSDRSLAPDSAERARALHLLNRLTFGPKPGEVDHVLDLGVDRYLDQQLHPEKIGDQALSDRLRAFDVLRKSPAELAQIFAQVARQRQQRQRASTPDSAMDDGADSRRQMMREQRTNPLRRLLGEYQQATVVREAYSERQLYEVMVDFWTNHFNVFIGKGADRFLLPGYIEETIRPRALGRFEDLLLATAQSPAMMFYLDNAQSVAPGSRPPQLERLEAMRGRRPGRFGARQRMDPERRDSMVNRLEARMPKGINENYAREVMELHTLGVDGGYHQQDVENLARILTGWSISRVRGGGGPRAPSPDPRFVFNDWAHDRGEKSVLGQKFPAGHGMDEGVEALKILARHPSTMRHISAKLCARFVSDDPSDGCIDAGVHAWQRTGGDIREVVRGIITSPEFWDAKNRSGKVKTPLEFVLSAVRAVGAEPDSSLALAQVVGRLGQPLFGQQPPTGYPETQESWVNAGALLQRMSVALGIAANRVPGTRVDLDGIIPATDDIDLMIRTINAKVLNGAASPNTLRTMRDQTGDLPTPEMKRAMIVGLALGSPEFQRQ